MKQRYSRGETATNKGDIYDHAYQATMRLMRRWEEDPKGGCIVASVLFAEYLRRHGIQAHLVQRSLGPGRGGHNTVRTLDGEFDPTCGWWPDERNPYDLERPADAIPHELYRVRRGQSPHGGWRQTFFDEEREYEVARYWDRKLQRTLLPETANSPYNKVKRRRKGTL